MKHNSGVLALIFSSLIMVITFSIIQTQNIGSQGLVVDLWTVPQFLVGATIFFLNSFLISLTENKRDSLQIFYRMEIQITIIALLLWETYEIVTNPSFWMFTIFNNVMDVTVGLIGLKCGILIEGMIPNKITGN